MSSEDTLDSVESRMVGVACVAAGGSIALLQLSVQAGVAVSITASAVQLAFAAVLFVAGTQSDGLVKSDPLKLHVAVWLTVGWYLLKLGYAMQIDPALFEVTGDVYPRTPKQFIVPAMVFGVGGYLSTEIRRIARAAR